jgi:hypothetical protein
VIDQCWFQDEAFRSAVFAWQPPDNLDLKESPLFQLQVTFAALQEAATFYFNPKPLVKSLRLSEFEQQDAQEYAQTSLSAGLRRH